MVFREFKGIIGNSISFREFNGIIANSMKLEEIEENSIELKGIQLNELDSRVFKRFHNDCSKYNGI